MEKKTCLDIRLSEVVVMPNITVCEPEMHLGKSKHGVCCTTIYRSQLQAWVLLEESKPCLVHEWVLKYQFDLIPALQQYFTRAEGLGDRDDNRWDSSGEIHIDDSKEEEEVEELDGDAEQDIIFNNIHFMGYHHNKEIAFLETNNFDGFAYYLGTSKLHYLGSHYLEGCINSQYVALHKSFIYTPCLDDLLPTCNDP